MVFAIALAAIAGALGLYYYVFKDFNYFKKYGIPHITPLPLVGNMGGSLFLRQPVPYLIRQVYEVQPDAKYVGFYDLAGPIVMIRDPELIKAVTLKHFDTFQDHRVFISDDLDPSFARNLFSLQGERWKEVRNFMSPTFTSSKMKSMFKLMSDCAVSYAEFLQQLPEEKRVLQTKDTFTRYTNDVVATCAFGVSVDSLKNPNNQFYLSGKKVTVFDSITMLKFYVMMCLPRLARMFKLRLISDRVADFFRELIQTTIRTREEQGIVRPDMLQLMMENRKREDGKELTVDDMIGQAFSFFLGGFDTTSTLMCFAAHEIAVNRDIHDRLQKEVDQVLEETNGEAHYEAINAMEYLDAVIHEALRMYPVSLALDRLCAKDYVLPPTLPGTRPFTVKKGFGVWVPTYALHFDPKYFSDPEKFDPERFLGERKKENLNSGVYYPFGLGPRMCIGNRFALLETKMLFFHLLAHCNLRPCEKTPMPIKLANAGFDMRPEGGFWLRVEPRKNPRRAVAAEAAANETR